MRLASRKDAEALDANDPLRDLRAAFDLPQGVIYLDGNSLGPPPRAALARLRQTAESEWQDGLIRSWNDAAWIDLPKRCGARIARLIGAPETDVIVCDTVSVNIFKLAGALRAQHQGALACEADEFPTDGYILEGLATLTGAPLLRLSAEGLEEAFAQGARILVKSAVHYRTASVADIALWERAAAKAGAAIIWDLSHAAGLIDLDLERDGARFAVGCGYKFLNGGPGAPSFVYAASEAASRLAQPLCGWMGHAAPFDFSDRYRPAPGAMRFACGTPPILSLSALDAALEIYEGVDMAAVEKKAQALGDLFLSRALSFGLESVSPAPGKRRGGHVALRHEHGLAVMQALIAKGVIGDFRAPDLMRFGFSPLYLGYADIWDAADSLKTILDKEEWRDPVYARKGEVT